MVPPTHVPRMKACFPKIERLAAAISTSKKGQVLRLFLLIALSILISLGSGCGVASPSASAATNAHLAVSMPSPVAEVGVDYSSVATVSGGSAPYVFSLERGTLPRARL
jgi:hypothetical protein